MEIWGTLFPHEYSREIIVFHTFKELLSHSQTPDSVTAALLRQKARRGLKATDLGEEGLGQGGRTLGGRIGFSDPPKGVDQVEGRIGRGSSSRGCVHTA